MNEEKTPPKRTFFSDALEHQPNVSHLKLSHYNQLI
jgi:hypothetical protein